MAEFDKKEFQKKFPNLSKELEGGEKVPVGGTRTDPKEAEKKLASHDPAAVDFLRRCDTIDQGIEIIEYLEKRGEIEEGYAQALKSQLLKKGIESFGTKKRPGHYLDR
jgi:hypothetical protein